MTMRHRIFVCQTEWHLMFWNTNKFRVPKLWRLPLAFLWIKEFPSVHTMIHCFCFHAPAIAALLPSARRRKRQSRKKRSVWLKIVYAKRRCRESFAARLHCCPCAVKPDGPAFCPAVVKAFSLPRTEPGSGLPERKMLEFNDEEFMPSSVDRYLEGE